MKARLFRRSRVAVTRYIQRNYPIKKRTASFAVLDFPGNGNPLPHSNKIIVITFKSHGRERSFIQQIICCRLLFGWLSLGSCRIGVLVCFLRSASDPKEHNSQECQRDKFLHDPIPPLPAGYIVRDGMKSIGAGLYHYREKISPAGVVTTRLWPQFPGCPDVDQPPGCCSAGGVSGGVWLSAGAFGVQPRPRNNTPTRINAKSFFIA
jgi:hypothetical protein